MSFFGKVIDQMTETSEQMIKVVEDGAAILMGYDRGNDDKDVATFAHESGGNSDGTFDFSQLSEEQILNEPSPLNDIAEGLLSDLMSHQVGLIYFILFMCGSVSFFVLNLSLFVHIQQGPQSLWEQFQAFKAAITWGEPFILSLLCFHITILFANIFIMKSGNLVGRFILIGVLALVIRSAEIFNQYGSSHWESFATQDYFDKNGVFISLMLSTPLLLIAFIDLIVLLRESKNLLIEVKTLQLKAKRKKKSKQSGNGNTTVKSNKKEN